MNKKLYVFTIKKNIKENITQFDARDEIIKLLEITPILFELNGNKAHPKRTIPEQDFTFETAEECREFALKLLETRTFFFCELKKVKVK